MEDPPFVVDVRYLDNEEDLKAFRKGDLIYHHN